MSTEGTSFFFLLFLPVHLNPTPIQPSFCNLFPAPNNDSAEETFHHDRAAENEREINGGESFLWGS